MQFRKMLPLSFFSFNIFIVCFLLCLFCRLENEADLIRENSEKALNTSLEALNVAEDALAKPDALRGDLLELELQ